MTSEITNTTRNSTNRILAIPAAPDGDAAEPEHGRDQRDDQEDQGPSAT